MVVYNHLRHTTTIKYDNNGKGWYFRFDGENKMSYRYILSIIEALICQLNIYNTTDCNEDNEGDRKPTTS